MKFAPLLMSPKKARTPRARRMRRWVMALALYSITGFLIAPAILKWQLVKQLPKFTRRQAAIRQVRMNPFALSLTIRGLALTETNGEPFAAFDPRFPTPHPPRRASDAGPTGPGVGEFSATPPPSSPVGGGGGLVGGGGGGNFSKNPRRR